MPRLPFDLEAIAEGLGRRFLEVRDDVRRELDAALDGLTDEQSVHDQLVRDYVVDATWARDRAVAAAAKLNALRSGPPLEPVVLWAKGRTAFTLPRRWLYLTRELVEVLPTEGAIGFVLGHEMAHHDLGHLALGPRLTASLGRIPFAGDAALLAKHALMVWARPEWELAADVEAARLCVACGWSVEDGVVALRAIERWALDHRAIDAVFGFDPEEAGPFGEWLRQRRTGYLSLRDRIERLEALA